MASSISSNIQPEIYLSNFNPKTLFLFPTNETEILKIVGKLKNKSSTGYDDISCKLLKDTVNYIVKPLTKIINLSLSCGKFPEKMKTAKVIPIFKTGQDNKFNNYRPISLLPVFSKVLEKIVFDRVFNFLIKIIKFLILNMDFVHITPPNML